MTPPNDIRRLGSLAEIAIELGDTDAADEARWLAERVASGRFYVACVGQFKRGKSTLLNALLGTALLPIGVVPVTAVVTVVRYGETLAARIRTQGEWLDVDPMKLDEYVAEARNPENAKGVHAVEVFVPSPLLQSGLCLVDTPGVGSINQGNTEATREFIPQIDAALVVIGADPPLAQSELDLIVEMGVDVERMIFVLAKADRLDQTELNEAKDFAMNALQRRLGRMPHHVFEVSARETTTQKAPTREWTRLEAALIALGEHGAAALVRSAGRRGATRLGRKLAHEIQEAIAALRRPREETQARISALTRAVADAERALADMTYLFNAVQDELARRFENDRTGFLREKEPVALADLSSRIRIDAADDVSHLAAKAMEHARTVAREHVMAWRQEHAPIAERLYEEAGRRFVDLANEFLRRVAASGEEGLAALPDTFEADTQFRTKPKFYFHEQLTIGSPSVAGRIAGTLQGRDKRIAAIESEAGEYLRRLLETNSHRSANDFTDQVRESRTRLHTELRKHLRGVIFAAERSLARATQAMDAGTSTVVDELTRLAHLGSTLEAVMAP